MTARVSSRKGPKIQLGRPCKPLRKTRLGPPPVALPIEAAQQAPSEILELPALAQANGLTNYDAAYLKLALRFNLPLATSDSDLLRAGASIGVRIL